MAKEPRRRRVHVTQVVGEKGHRYEEPVTPPICDFCADIGPAWDYPCESFQVMPPSVRVPFASHENWLACDPCHELIQQAIETGDVDSLIARMTSSFPLRGKELALLRRDMRVIYGEFLARRTGDPEPWG